MEGPVVVLGVGNVLAGDDAAGPTVVARLVAGWDLPEGVSALDVGTPGADLVPVLDGARAVIVVDTVSSDAAPGTLRTWSRDELLGRGLAPRLTPHQPGVTETLLTLEFAGGGPAEVLLIGVVPTATEVGIGLSDPVRAALDALEGRIVDELGRLGVPPRRADPPREPELWWERPPDEAAAGGA